MCIDTIYDRNISALKEKYPEIVQFLNNESILESEICSEKIDVFVQNIDGKSVLAAQKANKVYQLDSLYNESDILNTWYKGLNEDWALDSKLVMFGFGNGSFARKFLESSRKDCRIIVHEPSVSIFIETLKHFDVSDILRSDRLTFVWKPCIDMVRIQKYYEDILNYTDIIAMSTCFHVNYPRLFTEECQDFITMLQGVTEFYLADQTVYERFGHDYNKNMFSNLSFMGDSYSLIKLARMMPHHVPAIIVAAGPSLDKNIHELKKAQGKCLIIATDTALRPLEHAGIRPDIAVIADGKKDKKYISGPEAKKVPLVCTLHSGTEFLHLHEGMKFFADDFCNHINNYCKKIGCDIMKLGSGGSVANDCFSLAMIFDCRHIILVGQDLAYTDDKTHSVDTVRGEQKTEVEDLEHVIWCEDIYGNKVRSSSEFKLYREWFEDTIRRHPALRVIDATEGGARIAGTELMSLQEAINRECTQEFDFSLIIKNAEPFFNDEQRMDFNRFVCNIPNEIKHIERIVKEAHSDYIAMRKMVEAGNYKTSRFKSLYEKCNRASEHIEELDVFEYIHNQLQNKNTELLSVVNKLEKNEQEELLTACRLGEKYLQDIEEAICELDEYIDIIKKDFR